VIVAAVEIPASVSIKQSSRIDCLKSNTSIAIHTYRNKKKNTIHTCTYMSLKTYNCCERKRRKEKENINCLGAVICPSLTSELTEFSSSTNCPIVQDKISSSENPDNNKLPFRKTIHTSCC
jgi:hypothetical protein